MQIILPPIVEHNMAIDSALEMVESARARADYLKWFDRELKQIDSRLSLERARTDVNAPGLVPGYWHIVRDNTEFGAPKSMYPIMDHEGGFLEPSSAVLEHLKRNDLQRPGAMDDLRRREQRARDELAKAKERLHGERIAEIADRIKAYDSPGVSLAKTNRSWSYRARAKRAA